MFRCDDFFIVHQSAYSMCEPLTPLGQVRFWRGSGFWHIIIFKNGKVKTAFLAHDGLFSFNLKHFESCNSTASCERMADTLLWRLKWSISFCNLHNSLVFSSTFAYHLYRLAQAWGRFRSAGLQFSSDKCVFEVKHIKLLGHRVSSENVRPAAEKTNAVRNVSTPSALKHVHLCTYHRKFIPHSCRTSQWPPSWWQLVKAGSGIG